MNKNQEWFENQVDFAIEKVPHMRIRVDRSQLSDISVEAEEFHRLWNGFVRVEIEKSIDLHLLQIY
jgi:hypothetical protein